MELITNWKEVAKKAWSMRMLYLAIVFSICEVALMLLPVWREVIPQGTFAILAAIAETGAVVGRVLKQKEFPDAG